MSYTSRDDNHKQLVTAMGFNMYGYGNNGNQVTRNVSGSSYTLSYDAENRLVGVTGAATASFVYDGDGNRVKATAGTTTTTYVGSYFEWVSSTSNMIKYYYAGATRVAMRTGSSTINYLLGDHLGSQAITTNSSGVKSAEVRYYPWGNTRYTSGTTPTTVKFTGQRLESGIGLYFYNARWYDASAGRFISADTMIPGAGNPQAYDRYAYVLNNPLKYTDPSGHRTCTDERAATGDETCDQNNSAEDLVYLIAFLFNWEVEGEWLKDELLTILEAGKDIRSFIDSSSGKSVGAKWIRNHLGTTFTHGNRVNELLKRSTTQWRDVELYKGFNKETIVHELGHILDNHAGSSTGFPATWKGGGSADGLIWYLGGIPFGVRWLQVGILNLPDEYQWEQGVDSGYGNKASAEYFAQTFKYAVYDPTRIPGGTDLGGPYAFMQALIAVTVTFLGP